MPHPKPHQTEGEGGAVLSGTRASAAASAPEYSGSPALVAPDQRRAESGVGQDRALDTPSPLRDLAYQQSRPYQEDGHLAADDWWRLHPEGMA